VSFRVLFVCTGNICRSPIAERLLRARVGNQAPPLTAASAGTRAVTGYGMDRDAATVLRELGGDPDRHVARQLTPGVLAWADLVLTATTAHRSDVIQTDPMAMRRTFTMREFVRLATPLASLATDSSVPTLQAYVAKVADQRGHAEPAAPGADDIADPYRMPLPVMQECGREIASVVDGLLAVMGIPRG
jgi:protein-tyrosine phosphatase